MEKCSMQKLSIFIIYSWTRRRGHYLQRNEAWLAIWVGAVCIGEQSPCYKHSGGEGYDGHLLHTQLTSIDGPRKVLSSF